MKHTRALWATLITLALLVSLCACTSTDTTQTNEPAAEETSEPILNEEQAYIESILNLANNTQQTWTYAASADAWVLSPVSAVAYPELPDQQGVSVCVPGAYVSGIDVNADGEADVTAADASDAVAGTLVMDYEAQIVSPNGQTYTAATAPVIFNTGAAGYGSQQNSAAGTSHAASGYINVTCGNRGKSDSVTDEAGNITYTGDAPSCLADQKAAARFVKYNILLGNLPGSVDHFVSTGGSGGGAHAAMFAATGNHPDFYDYQIEAGAVGVYKNDDGSYSTTVTIDGTDHAISDGAWGCIAYSAITSLYEADMALAFEYYLDAAYAFGSPFQAQTAEYLAAAYMEYINAQNLAAKESALGFDLNADGDTDDLVPLTIEYDPEAYPETRGYYGSYLDLYLAEFTQNLQWYLDNLDYAEGWTWFDAEGVALTNEEAAAMTAEDKAIAFLEGRYAKGSSGKGGFGDGVRGDGIRGDGDGPSGDMDFGGPDDDDDDGPSFEMLVGTPDEGTTQSATGGTDSDNYATYDEMLAAYRTDIAEIQAGDEYGNNIVDLYNPLNYIGAEGTENPTWTKLLMGAAEGDISMLNSLNLQLAWLSAGADAELEWQWNGGHVPSEVFGDSFSLYVDQMYGKYVEGAATVEKAEAVPALENGTATAPTGTDITSWVNAEDVTSVSFTLADAASYRTAGASKAIPGFDVIDYGQEDYVFGSAQQNARHWNDTLLEIFQANAGVLSPLFNQQ